MFDWRTAFEYCKTVPHTYIIFSCLCFQVCKIMICFMNSQLMKKVILVEIIYVNWFYILSFCSFYSLIETSFNRTQLNWRCSALCVCHGHVTCIALVFLCNFLLLLFWKMFPYSVCALFYAYISLNESVALLDWMYVHENCIENCFGIPMMGPVYTHAVHKETTEHKWY